jgi:hypothetical protein
MKDGIGGYLQLDLGTSEPYHSNVVSVNSGRNALEYLLKTHHFSKIYVPLYMCEVLLEPINRLNLAYEFYSVDEQLKPILEAQTNSSIAVLYINYFGVRSSDVEELSTIHTHLIVDNSQAFFDKPISSVPTFYSPRKFFGLPDGGYVSTSERLEEPLDLDTSVDRSIHLLRRIESGAESGYGDFVRNDNALTGLPLKQMSKLTEALLGNIDYEKIKTIRLQNFNFLHEHLGGQNKLTLEPSALSGPMVYPFLIKDGKILKGKLIRERIFVATYWSNMRSYLPENSLEEGLINDLVPLPIDQRISIADLKQILHIINE